MLQNLPYWILAACFVAVGVAGALADPRRLKNPLLCLCAMWAAIAFSVPFVFPGAPGRMEICLGVFLALTAVVVTVWAILSINQLKRRNHRD